MYKRKHNGITLLAPAFSNRRFKFGTLRAIEKREQLHKKILIHRNDIPVVITNPAWESAVKNYFNATPLSVF